MTRTSIRSALLAVAAATAIAIAPAASAAAAPGTGSTAEGGASAVAAGTPTPLSDQQLADVAAKDAAVAQHLATKSKVARSALASGVASPQTTCTPGECSKTLGSIIQYPEGHPYWCGPATLVSLVGARGVSMSQYYASTLLGTTVNGTDWYSGNNRYPMAIALNEVLGQFGAVYAPTYVSLHPSSSEVSTFENRLVSDVDYNWGVAGNANEKVNGPHLIGHPNEVIQHWIAIRGFNNYGASTRYADSASGGVGITWGGKVPQYSEMSSSTIVAIMADRGYVW